MNQQEKRKHLVSTLLAGYKEDIETFLGRDLEDCEYENDDYLNNLLWNNVSELSESELDEWLSSWKERFGSPIDSQVLSK